MLQEIPSMGRRIRDLPEHLVKLVSLRVKEEKIRNGSTLNIIIAHHTPVQSCFVFGKTPEGQKYWMDICNPEIPLPEITSFKKKLKLKLNY